MIDIHSHIIQGVDDGSKDLEMSLDMARIYLENGISKVIGTPHYIEKDEKALDKNIKALDILRKELKDKNIPLEVYLGNEVYISMDILKDLRDKRITTLNGSRYILIEFPMREIPIYSENIIYELLLEGYIPIIAHPERYIKIQEDPNILLDFLEKGALAQLNLPSLGGLYGDRIKETAQILLDHKMIQFVGSDSHTNRRRSPKLKEYLEILKELITSQLYEEIVYKNASNVLEDTEFICPEAIEYKKKKTLFGFLGFNRG